MLRDQGFAPAVRALADQVGMENRIQIDLEFEGVDGLGENARVGLYQIIREALSQAVLRGPPNRVAVRVERLADGAIETIIWDDGTGERRRASLDTIAERARTLGGRLSAETTSNGGTTLRVVLPPYAAKA